MRDGRYMRSIKGDVQISLGQLCGQLIQNQNIIGRHFCSVCRVQGDLCLGASCNQDSWSNILEWMHQLLDAISRMQRTHDPPDRQSSPDDSGHLNRVGRQHRQYITGGPAPLALQTASEGERSTTDLSIRQAVAGLNVCE